MELIREFELDTGIDLTTSVNHNASTYIKWLENRVSDEALLINFMNWYRDNGGFGMRDTDAIKTYLNSYL
jgi:hypothetical protein